MKLSVKVAHLNEQYPLLTDTLQSMSARELHEAFDDPSGLDHLNESLTEASPSDEKISEFFSKMFA